MNIKQLGIVEFRIENNSKVTIANNEVKYLRGHSNQSKITDRKKTMKMSFPVCLI